MDSFSTLDDMPIKPLDRLMFAQGNQCFFCNMPLPKSEASVEHLVPSSRSGSNSDDNCVACCKAINNLLGNMSLQEKTRVVLNQNSKFVCPNGAGSDHATKPEPLKIPNPCQNPPTTKVDSYTIVLADLKSVAPHDHARLKHSKRQCGQHLRILKSLTDTQLEALIRRFQAEGKIIIGETKVSYSL